MIAYPRSENPAISLKVRIVGIGNAGVHLADRLMMNSLAAADIVAINTDAQSLASSVVGQKIVVGHRATRGLGTGGDPEVGYEAAQESMDEIRSSMEGASLIILCAGLGGGTGSGIAPVAAEVARELGATVFALATSPFSFEGRRRLAQAQEALEALAPHCDSIIHFENDRMTELSSPRAGIEQTFAASDMCLSDCVISLLEILRGGSPMPVGLSDLLASVGGGSASALFGRGEATGDNRAHEALERALRSPLLDRGRMLDEGHSVIAHVSGPPSLSFSEVAAIMRELGKHAADDAHLFLGVTTRPDEIGPLSVTILGNYAGSETGTAPRGREAEVVSVEPEAEEAPPAAVTPPPERKKRVPAPSTENPPSPLFPDKRETEPAPRPAPAVARETRPPAPAPKPPAPAKAKQETLPFESVARGRFEKSEPTIVEGEDLDVPTFLRMRGKGS